MPAALIGAGIGAVGSVAGGSSSKKGQKKAAKIQQQTAREAAARAEALYGDIKNQYAGSIATGQKATNTLNGLLGLEGGDSASAQAALNNFRNSGGYQTAMTEGTRAVGANRAAAGAFLSGSTAKALQDRGNYLGQQTLGNYAQLLYGQQGIGESAKAAIAGAGTNNVQAVNNAYNQSASAASNAALAKANSQANMFGQLGQLGAYAYGQMNPTTSYNPVQTATTNYTSAYGVNPWSSNFGINYGL